MVEVPWWFVPYGLVFGAIGVLYVFFQIIKVVWRLKDFFVARREYWISETEMD